MKRSSILTGAIGALLAGLGVWAFWLEPASFRIARYPISIPAWPQQCDGMQIAVLSDLHIGSPFNGLKNLEDIVNRTNAAAPDLILLPGDFVIQGVLGGTFIAPESAAGILGKLHAPMGVYAVLGNHDWWLDAHRVQAALESQGIPVLEDRSVVASHEGCAINLVGVSDFREGPHDVSTALNSASSALSTLAFTHNPDIFPELPPSISLTIAGHTHGGQVFLPLIGRPIVPSKYGSRYATGHIEEMGRHMFVSSGIGTSILPARFLVPPEVTLLQVMAAE